MSQTATEEHHRAGASSSFQVSVAVRPHSSGPPGTMDIAVGVPGPPGQSADWQEEFYFNLYVTDLHSREASWAPRNPITYPEISSLKAPFTQTLKNLEFRHAFVGILVSVCNAFHEEVEWHCRIYRTSDGVEVRDCRAPLTYRWQRRTG